MSCKPAEIENLIARLLDWDEWDEGKINDARYDAVAALRAMQAETERLRGAMTDADNDVILAHQTREAAEAKLADALATHKHQGELYLRSNERNRELAATVATLTAQVEAMRGALDEIDTKANNGAMTSTYSEGTLRSILKRIRDRARAALTTENQTNG